MSEEEPKMEMFFNSSSSELIKEKEKDSDNNKKDPQESNDVLSFDKKFWNLNMNEIQYPDISLKKESESKLSIDNNDRIKEYLNEDLLNALEVSPMNTPKNILKDPKNENNINNNDNIININEEMLDPNNKDLFQFSLYNNKNEENEENNNINDKEKDTENNNDNDVINLQQKYNINIDNIDLKIEDNKIEGNNLDNLNIIEDQGGGNNINNIISQENIIDNNLIEKNLEKKIENTINTINISPTKQDNEEKETKDENPKPEKMPLNQKETVNNQEKKPEENSNQQNFNQTKNYYQQPSTTQYQQYATSFIQFPNIMNVIQPASYGHENKFDGNKKYKVLVPFTVLKNNVKMKKPFEIREGDWTCSNCNNLNFSFRAKCNRCNITKEQSEQNKQKESNNKDKNFIPSKKQNFGNNINMMPYKNYIVQKPVFAQGKYYPGYIYIPIQGTFLKKYQKGEKEKKNE
jgi:hypothetical protein